MAETGPQGSATNAPDWSEIARKLLDLWQDHLSAVAADPDLTAQMLRLLAANPAQGGVLAPGGAGKWFQNPWSQSFWGAATGGPGGNDVGANNAGPDSRAAKDGAQAAAPASDAGAVALGELRDRLARLEGRLAALDGGNENAGKRKGAKPGRPAGRGGARSRKA